jgi:enoyl-CoA hydratase/carnithine racemase
VGIAHTLELCMTGAMIDAQEALRIGLANKVCASGELLDAAVATATTIAAMGPLAIATVKEVITGGADKPLDEANLLEQQGFAGLFASDDQSEGMTAFMEKRKADFKGK